MILGQPQSLVREVLFHGSRGNGKSDALIMGFLQHVGKGWGRTGAAQSCARNSNTLKTL